MSFASTGRLAKRASKLDGVAPREVTRIEPCYSEVLFRELAEQRVPLPKAVRARIRKAKKANSDLCMELWLSLMSVDRKRDRRFFQPALHLADSTAFWNPSDYPKEFHIDDFVTYTRKGLLFEFANALLLRGYVLTFGLGEGCEWVNVPLATYGPLEGALWRGGSFTKTQYAAHFTRDHENVCRILDLADEEQLLLRVNDSCGFYGHRDWRKSAPIVNRETAFISAVSALVHTGVQAAQRAGVEVEIVQDPIKECKNYLKTD